MNTKVEDKRQKTLSYNQSTMYEAKRETKTRTELVPFKTHLPLTKRKGNSRTQTPQVRFKSPAIQERDKGMLVLV